jgi:hypothetical protein
MTAQSGQSLSMANTRSILTMFDKYQKDRLHFAQQVAEIAGRESNIQTLVDTGVLALLRPLLSDPVPSVQQAAAVALGRYISLHLYIFFLVSLS